MIGEVRQALLLQRLRYGAEEITHQKAFQWATIGSAGCLGRDDIGKIAVGKQADIALFKLDEIRFAGAGSPVAAILLCGATKADKVMVAGKWRVLEGQIVGVDMNQLMAKQITLAANLARA
ncbi:8-oxoguanine deaminase [Psychrobacter sp. SC65A.3]|nr:8-oxoguanine deaminase [Psychrobacter sp. SC65A.3]